MPPSRRPPLSAELERRLRALEDREALAELLRRYAAAQDERRFDDYEACFTDDVVLEFPWGAVEGREGLADRVRELLAPFSYTQHLIGNVQVEVGEDQASGRADFFVTMVRRDHPRLKFWQEVGFYRHRYRRTAEGWRISRIECVSQLRWQSYAKEGDSGA
jgi:3-phenylpropionate/cinnamic acid dioxygenase small subunit